MKSIEYTAEKLAALRPTEDHSLRYWRSEARRILAAHPTVKLVEIVRSGRKTDSIYLARGAKHSPRGIAVVVASTGGKWGRSRRNYYPAA